MKGYLFPGQGAQFAGMGKSLVQDRAAAEVVFQRADDILGFELSKIMRDGSAEELKQTKYTQPAVFLHSIATIEVKRAAFQPTAVAGHSLGEFSALVAAGALRFDDGLRLVYARAQAMQKACEEQESTMAAILGVENELVERVCASIEGEVVVPANYNTAGQLVISGTVKGIDMAIERLKASGAKRAIKLEVGGAFHSPLMEPASAELEKAINETAFSEPRCPIFQNVNARPTTDPEEIKRNLVAQLTAPVRWQQTIEAMVEAGIQEFIEVGGSGKVLQGMVKKINKEVNTGSM